MYQRFQLSKKGKPYRKSGLQRSQCKLNTAFRQNRQGKTGANYYELLGGAEQAVVLVGHRLLVPLASFSNRGTTR